MAAVPRDGHPKMPQEMTLVLPLCCGVSLSHGMPSLSSAFPGYPPWLWHSWRHKLCSLLLGASEGEGTGPVPRALCAQLGRCSGRYTLGMLCPHRALHDAVGESFSEEVAFAMDLRGGVGMSLTENGIPGRGKSTHKYRLIKNVSYKARSSGGLRRRCGQEGTCHEGGNDAQI